MTDITVCEELALQPKPHNSLPKQGSAEYAVEKAKIAIDYIIDFLKEGDVESALQMAQNIRIEYDE